MPEGRITILSTRPLEQSLINWAYTQNIVIDAISFIRTEPIADRSIEERVAEIALQPSTVIFTSMNAAETVADYSPGLEPQWNIYCLGTATKKVIQQRFPLSSIVGEANNALELAEVIAGNNEKFVVFFCGDQRRDELPEKLTGNGISLEEVVVYRTIPIPGIIEKEYDGFLFFSPSAVKSFFSSNTVSPGSILFAIGSTTADCIRTYSDNPVIVSEQPGKQHLVEESVNYFCKLNRTDEHIKK